MKFENKGKWLKEAQDKMAARDTMEDPDFLDGNDKVLAFEEEELDMEDDDNFEDVEEETIEESSQKNEAVTKASKQLLSWAKLPQVKAAIAKADEKTFRKLMEEFTKSIGSTEDFPMTSIKNGKLVFALTDTPITIDSLVKEWFDDRYLFESAQKNESAKVDYKEPGRSVISNTYRDYNDAIDALKTAKGSQPTKGTKIIVIVESSQKNESEDVIIGSGINSDYYEYKGTRYTPGPSGRRNLAKDLAGKKPNFIKGKNTFKKELVSDEFFNQMKDNLLKDLVKSESSQKNEAKNERVYDINFDNVGGGFTVEKSSNHKWLWN